MARRGMYMRFEVCVLPHKGFVFPYEETRCLTLRLSVSTFHSRRGDRDQCCGVDRLSFGNQIVRW